MSVWRAVARGFSLIEMAIVLVVIGLILSGGLMAITPVLQGTKATETNVRLDLIEKALVLYTIRNGCLPCPANGDLATSAGLAEGSTAYSAGCQTCAALTTGSGVVPWGALGLSQKDAMDGWGNRISYVVTGALTQTSTSMNRTGSTYPAGTLDLNDSVTIGTPLTTAAAYVLISHGNDGRGARTSSGTTIAAPDAANVVQYNNTRGSCDSAGTLCYQGDLVGISGTGEYDDIVRWRTAPLIIQQCGDNACGNPA
ncbi:MAG: type II secretion system protein [Rhodospirillaceae bacterium]